MWKEWNVIKICYLSQSRLSADLLPVGVCVHLRGCVHVSSTLKSTAYLSADLPWRDAHFRPLHFIVLILSYHTAWRDPLNFYLLIKITKLLFTVCPSCHQGRYKLPPTMARNISQSQPQKFFSPLEGSLPAVQTHSAHNENNEQQLGASIRICVVWIPNQRYCMHSSAQIMWSLMKIFDCFLTAN